VTMRVMFIVYLTFIAAGLAYAISIGLLHQ
jgi:hypothetical protein